jgi:hypothetical protein
MYYHHDVAYVPVLYCCNVVQRNGRTCYFGPSDSQCREGFSSWILVVNSTDYWDCSDVVSKNKKEKGGYPVLETGAIRGRNVLFYVSVAYIQQGQARCFLGRVPAFALCAF